MADSVKVVRVAAVQAAPVIFDREATLSKALKLIREAADQEARIIVFPEAYIPAYPVISPVFCNSDIFLQTEAPSLTGSVMTFHLDSA